MENALVSHPPSPEARGRWRFRDAKGWRRPLAVVVLKADCHDAGPSCAVFSHVRSRNGSAQASVFVPELPPTSTGKLLKSGCEPASKTGIAAT